MSSDQSEVKVEPPDEEDIQFDGLVPLPTIIHEWVKEELIATDEVPEDLVFAQYEKLMKEKEMMQKENVEATVKKEEIDQADCLKTEEERVMVKNEVIDIDEMAMEYMGDYIKTEGGEFDRIINNMKQDPDFYLKAEENEEDRDLFFYDQMIMQIELNPMENGEHEDNITNLYDHIKRKSAARRNEMEKNKEETRLNKKRTVGGNNKKRFPRKDPIQKKKQKKQKIGWKHKEYVVHATDCKDGGEVDNRLSIEQRDPTKRIRRTKIPYDPSNHLDNYQSRRQNRFYLQSTPSFNPLIFDDQDNQMMDEGVDHSSTIPPLPFSYSATQLHNYSVPVLSLPSVEDVQHNKIRKGESGSPIDIPLTNQSPLINLIDPRRRKETMNGLLAINNQYYDPRRIQKKELERDFIPHPPDYYGFPRVVCGPIPQGIPIEAIYQVIDCHNTSPHHYKFTQFEGSIYVWLKCLDNDVAFNLIQSRPIRMGPFSPAFCRPYTVLVDVGGPIGNDYLFSSLNKFGQVIGLEKIEAFKWKATYLEEIDGMRATNEKEELYENGKRITYSPFIVTPPIDPPVECKEEGRHCLRPLSVVVPQNGWMDHSRVSRGNVETVRLSNDLHPLIMVRSTTEVEIKGNKGEGMAIFPLVDDKDAKECLIGMEICTSHLVIGPFPDPYMDLTVDTLRRRFQIHHEINVKIVGKCVHLFMDVSEPHSDEAKLHWDRFQNEQIYVERKKMEKGIPRSIIVETSSLHCTTQFIQDYFIKEYGGIISVIERIDIHSKMYAVNFFNREAAVNAYRTSIHSSSSAKGQVIILEICKN